MTKQLAIRLTIAGTIAFILGAISVIVGFLIMVVEI